MADATVNNTLSSNVYGPDEFGFYPTSDNTGEATDNFVLANGTGPQVDTDNFVMADGKGPQVAVKASPTTVAATTYTEGPSVADNIGSLIMARYPLAAAVLSLTACTPPPEPCTKPTFEAGVVGYAVNSNPTEAHECLDHTTPTAENTHSQPGMDQDGMASAAEMVGKWFQDNPTADVSEVLGTTDGNDLPHQENIDFSLFQIPKDVLIHQTSLEDGNNAVFEPATADGVAFLQGNNPLSLEGVTCDGIDPRAEATEDGFSPYVSDQTCIKSVVAEDGSPRDLTLSRVTVSDAPNGLHVSGDVTVDATDVLFVKPDRAMYAGPQSRYQGVNTSVSDTTGTSRTHTVEVDGAAEFRVDRFMMRNVDSAMSPLAFKNGAENIDVRSLILYGHVMDPEVAVPAGYGALVTVDRPGSQSENHERVVRFDSGVVSGTGYGSAGAMMFRGDSNNQSYAHVTGVDIIGGRGNYAYDINADGIQVSYARGTVGYGTASQGPVGNVQVTSINTTGNPFDNGVPADAERVAHEPWGVLLQDPTGPLADLLMQRAQPADTRQASTAFVVGHPSDLSPAGAKLLYGDHLYELDLVDGATWYINQSSIYPELNGLQGFGFASGPYTDDMLEEAALFDKLAEASGN